MLLSELGKRRYGNRWPDVSYINQKQPIMGRKSIGEMYKVRKIKKYINVVVRSLPFGFRKSMKNLFLRLT